MDLFGVFSFFISPFLNFRQSVFSPTNICWFQTPYKWLRTKKMKTQALHLRRADCEKWTFTVQGENCCNTGGNSQKRNLNEHWSCLERFGKEVCQMREEWVGINLVTGRRGTKQLALKTEGTVGSGSSKGEASGAQSSSQTEGAPTEYPAPKSLCGPTLI